MTNGPVGEPTRETIKAAIKELPQARTLPGSLNLADRVERGLTTVDPQDTAAVDRLVDSYQFTETAEPQQQDINHALARFINTGIRGQAETNIDRAQAHLENKLTGPQRLEVQQSLFRVLQHHPLYKARLAAGIADPNVKVELNKIIDDFGFRVFIGEQLSATLQKDLVDVVPEDKRDLVTQARDNYTQTDQELTDSRTKRSEFDPGQTKADVLKELEDNETTINNNYESAKQVHAQKEEDLNQKRALLNNAIRSGNTTEETRLKLRTETLEAEAKDIYDKEVLPAKNKVDQLAALRQEKAELDSKIKDLDARLDKYNKTLTEAQENLNGEFDGVFATAVKDWANEDIDRVVRQVIAEVDELGDSIQERHVANLLNQLRANLYRRETVGRIVIRGRVIIKGRQVIKVNEVAHNNLVESLGTTGFERIMVQQLVGNRNNPETDAQYTEDDVKKLLMDRELSNRMKIALVRNVIAASTAAGKSGEEMRAEMLAIATIPGIEDLMGEAMKTYPDFMKQVNSLANAHGFDHLDPAKRAEQATKMNPMLLLLLLGIIPVAVSAIATEE